MPRTNVRGRPKSKLDIDSYAITVHLYSSQASWTSAPSPDSEIGLYGQWGQESEGVNVVYAGDYHLIQTYEVNTVDFGTVRWLQLRCDSGDPTFIPGDEFAWLPARPVHVDCEALYAQMPDVEIDDYTQDQWDAMKEAEQANE